MSGYYNITFSCGHTERVRVDGNLQQQKQEVTHQERWVCSKCRSKLRDKAVVANSKGLPTLSGSDKQISYASRLRLDRINYLKELIQGNIVYSYEAEGHSQEEMINIEKEKLSEKQQETVMKEIKGYNNLVDELKRLETEESAVWIIEQYKNA